MKKLFTFSLAFFSMLNAFSQTHYCAEHKAQRFNKQAAINASTKKTAQSTAVPEHV